MKPKTEKELAAELSRLRRWRVKPDKDLGIGAMLHRAAINPAKFAADVKVAEEKRRG